MTKVFTALGMMSGTSLDGIDIALLRTDGGGRVERGAAMTVASPPAFRERLVAGLAEALTIKQRDARPGALAALEREITERHAAVVDSFCQREGLRDSTIDVIGFHGQTVLHRPADRLTVQLGDGALLAELTGITVVNDLRAADVAAGGQGAPFVPVYHRALAASLAERPVVFVNIGGVANVTFIGPQGELLAFDTGPGNAMLDDWVQRHRGMSCDTDGRLAAQGRVDEALLARWMRHDFFSRPAPKSLDRNDFDVSALAQARVEDGAATLTAFTAAAIAAGLAQLPATPALWVICGGGRHNPTLMGMVQARLPGRVVAAEAVGVAGDSVEAEAFAYLAVRSLRGAPLSFPGTTGVPAAMTGGVVHRPAGVRKRASFETARRASSG
ncbi:anhydro-N-acetylmuramic acid kinase [Rhodoligotrophos appendicifer]|uniref:anhydro-N-acetylmuramic acid kinase n=1 Tax=Rhodoligotrophos appendicifer TaxID=987056 RepID=UPI001184F3E4|nr:anhydro-N-acetylmuramic acid kinase [Rhodoligotrophos appendicifer]